MSKKKNPLGKAMKSVTYVALVMDKSSSMSDHNLTKSALEFVNQQISNYQEASQKDGHEINLATLSFNERVEVHSEPTEVSLFAKLTSSDYRPYGSTAMLDAVTKAVELLREHDSPAYLINVVTDGETNSDLYTNKFRFKELLQQLEKEGKWTIVFNVPKGTYKARLSRDFGIPEGNINEWEVSSKGLEEANQVNTSGTQSYFNSRARGVTKVASFYADVDLASLKKKDLRSLKDLSGNFKVLDVSKEAAINEFVEEKTKKDYVIGSTFYQLSKIENVQANKKVLIIKKGESAIYGGNDARELIGIPVGKEVKVNPKNLMDYEIYIQSTSPNRKLVRGTKVLWDFNLKKGQKPTWE